MSTSSAFEGYTFVIPAEKALPSNESCSHIFFENVRAIAGGNVMRFPRTPGVYCFPHRWTSDFRNGRSWWHSPPVCRTHLEG
jgi:hypothetical protein